MMRVVLKNKTSRMLYVDLGNSFFVRGETANAYYIPSSTTEATTGATGASVNLGSVAGGLGIGGAAGQILNGVNVGGGRSNTQQTTTYSQRIVAVPPLSTINLDLQDMFPDADNDFQSIQGIRHCPYVSKSDVIEIWLGKENLLHCGDVIKWNAEESPMRFSTIIAYSDTETCVNEKQLNAQFYLREMMGYSKIVGNGISDNGMTKNIMGMEDVFGFVLYSEIKNVYGKRFSGTFPVK